MLNSPPPRTKLELLVTKILNNHPEVPTEDELKRSLITKDLQKSHIKNGRKDGDMNRTGFTSVGSG